MKSIQNMADNEVKLVTRLHKLSNEMIVLSDSIVASKLWIDTLDEESCDHYMKLSDHVREHLNKFVYMAKHDQTAGGIHDRQRRGIAHDFIEHTMAAFYKPPIMDFESLRKYATNPLLSTRLCKLVSDRYTLSYVSSLKPEFLYMYTDLLLAIEMYVDKLDKEQTDYYLRHYEFEDSDNEGSDRSDGR